MVVLTRDRYIVFQAIVKSTVPNLTELKTTIWKKYETIFGLSGTSEAGLYFETFDEKNGTGLIRCSSRSLSSLLTQLQSQNQVYLQRLSYLILVQLID